MDAKYWVVALGCVAIVGCGGKKPPSMVTSKPVPTSEAIGGSEIEDSEVDVERGVEFDQEAADIVIKRGARKAQNCTEMGVPEGEGEVLVAFDGPKGRVVDVELPYVFMDVGKTAQSCLRNAFVGEYVPPFEGTKKVPFQLVIEAPKKK